jgi:hypothetical protein
MRFPIPSSLIHGPVTVVAVTGLAALLAVGAFFARSTTIEAAIVTFEVEMVGANEVPAASSPGTGFARFTFNDQTRELTYAVWLRGLSSNQVTASHIHRAPAGVAGPAVYTLASAPFDSLSGSIMLTEADVADLRAGNFYVNIHSTSIPSGFARGQLRLPASGGTISPPSTGDAGLKSNSDSGSAALLVLVLAATASAAIAVRGVRTS